MAKQTQHHGRAWYVIHTYSGYEDNVMRNLKQRIESMDMQDLIFDVMVPKENKIKIKNGKRTVVEERIYPGYVLVNMIVTDASWYVSETRQMSLGSSALERRRHRLIRAKLKC